MYEHTENSTSLKTSLRDKISFMVLLTMTFLLPVFFVPSVFISTQFSTSLLFAFSTILVVFICLISVFFSGSISLPKNKYILIFTALVPSAYFLAGIANGFSRISFFGYTFDQTTVGSMVLAFAYMFLVSLLFRNQNKIFYSYVSFVVSSIILSLFFLLRFIFGVKFLAFGIFTDLTSSVLGGWNNVGIFFGICVLLSLLTHELLEVSKFMKILLTGALVLALLFLLLVNFTAIWIILGICSFSFILYSVFGAGSLSKFDSEFNIGVLPSYSFKHRLARISIYPVIVFVLSVILVVSSSSVGTYLSNHLKVSNVEVRPSFAVTFDIARNTIQSRPLFGAGPNSFVTEWLKFKPDDVIGTVYWNTDFTNGIGLIPTFAVTTGLVGFISWLLFFGIYIYLGLKSIFTKVQDSFIHYLLVSSFFISLYLWIMAWIYVPSTVIFILTFFFTGLFFASMYSAEIVSTVPYVFSRNPRTGFLSSLLMVVVFVGVIILGYGLVKSAESLWYFQKSSYELNGLNNLDQAESYMSKAILSVPNDVYYRTLSEIEIARMSKILSQDQKIVPMETIQNQFSTVLTDAIKAGISAKEADSTNYLNWIALGRVYEAVSAPDLKVEGAYVGAQVAYTEALRRNPKNPGILVLLARLALTAKDLKQAKIYATQAITQKQNYIDAYFLLSQIEIADKNISGAIQSVTAASVISPTDPGIFFQLGLLKYNIQDFKGAIEALEKSISITPDYANAKYFLGLSYEATGQHAKAIVEFTDLKKTNPNNKEVAEILANLIAGKQIFTNIQDTDSEKGTRLPLIEKNRN